MNNLNLMYIQGGNLDLNPNNPVNKNRWLNYYNPDDNQRKDHKEKASRDFLAFPHKLVELGLFKN